MSDKFGGYLKQLRAERGYSLKQAKDRTGISESYLWQLENGKRGIPRPETVEKLAEGYGVPAETLLIRAGYSIKPADDKKEAAAAKTHLFRDYEKLSDESKKQLEIFLAGLRQKDEMKR